MAWPLECLREAERHPYGLAVCLWQRDFAQFSGSFVYEVRQWPALRAWSSCRLSYSLSRFTLEGLEQDCHRVGAA